MASMPAAVKADHPDSRIRDGVLIFPMPVEACDCLMNHETLPRGACYNCEALEVEAMPDGREHDPRADAVYAMFAFIRVLAGVNIRAGTSLPLQTSPEQGGDRRHPDACLYLEPAKIERLRTDRAHPVPAPDVVVAVDYIPLNRVRYRQRLDAYARIGVPEVWTWARVASATDEPDRRTTFHVARADGYADAAPSVAAPARRPADLNALLNEPDDERRETMAQQLAERPAPHIAESPLLARP